MNSAEFISLTLFLINVHGQYVANNQDPNWLPKNNLQLAFHGVDISLKHPFSLKNSIDPSIKGLIFSPTKTGQRQTTQHQFYTAYERLVCDTKFEENEYGNFEEYSNEKIMSTITKISFGLEFNKTVPINAGYQYQHEDEEKKLHEFVDKEGGKIIRSKIECNVYTVNIPNIQSDRLALHNGFVNAMRQLDQAANEDQETEAIYNLIKNFGTHFAQETIMGIGAEFETRITQEESNTMNRDTVHSCTTHGGFGNLAFVKAGGQTTTCPANWNNSTKLLKQKGITRYVSTSYGIPSSTGSLENWTNKIDHLYSNGRLQPIPIKQTLVPIYELFNTTIVRGFKKPVDVEKIIRIAKKGFSSDQYCKMFACRRPSCSGKIHFNGENFYETNIPSLTAANDRVYQGDSSNYLYYYDGGWKIGPDFNDADVLWRNLPCPQHNYEFILNRRDLLHAPTYSPKWSDCAERCFKSKDLRNGCKYWQYSSDKKQCSLIITSPDMRVTNSNTIVGPNDCPNGKKAVSYSNSGRCPENMDSKSIWVKKGQETFAKDTKITVSECGCNLEGALDNKCNYQYGCTCKRGYTGRKCDQCENGFEHPSTVFYRIFISEDKKTITIRGQVSNLNLTWPLITSETALNISKNKCVECSQNCNLCDSCRTTQMFYVPKSGQCSTNNCDFHGENYRWCYIENGDSTWDYCESQEERYTCCGRDTDKERQLWNAARYGRLDEVRQLLQTTYVDPLQPHPKGSWIFGKTTPLIQAAKNGHTDIVQILLDHDANIDVQIHGGVDNSDSRLFEALLGVIGNVPNFKISANFSTALILAAMEGHKDVVQLLLKRGANTKIKSNWGQACKWNERVDNIISC